MMFPFSFLVICTHLQSQAFLFDILLALIVRRHQRALNLLIQDFTQISAPNLETT